jgi:carboxyl-terminal processing protease
VGKGNIFQIAINESSMQILSLVLLFLLLTGQAISQTVYPTRIKSGIDTFVDSRIRGTWRSVGDGFLINAGEKNIILYSFTSKHCYTEENDYVSDLLNNNAHFSVSRSKDTLSIYLQDFGGKTTQLQPAKQFYRLEKLPGHCNPLSEQQRKDPEFLFDLFWVTLKENYAFAKERHLKWDTIYSVYKPKITSLTTQEELFRLMGEVVTLTKDQHTKIISSDGKTLQYSGLPTAIKLREIFDQQDSVKNFNDYITAFFKTNYNNISNDLLKRKGTKVANGKIEWGDITPAIGYIHIHSLTGFASNKLSRKQHLDTLNFYMTQIMRSFEHKKAVIVDVSFNFGGYDAAGLTISSYFTSRPVMAYTKYSFERDSFYNGSNLMIYPSANFQFTKPVFVVATDISRSAAETFVMQMKTLPNVKVVGTNTLGILSDMLGKSIGDYYLTLSNEKYVSSKGNMYETIGVAPDIKLDVFPKESMFNGHRDAILKIVSLIEQTNIGQ